MSGATSAQTALSVHKLTQAEVPAASEMLARAFVADPFVNWVVRGDELHDEVMPTFFKVCLEQLTMPFGEVWATDDVSGVALWTPPGRFRVGWREELRFLGAAVHVWGLGKIPSRIAGFSAIEHRHPTEPHFYLFFLGVDPRRAGQGIGTTMMRSVLDRCDAEGLPAYLEATREDLVPFYGRFGYELRPTIAVPHGGPTLYPMWREPQAECP